MELAGARIRKARWNPGGRTLELLLRAGGTGTEEDTGAGGTGAPEGGGGAPDGSTGAPDGTDFLLRYRNVGLLEPALPAFAALVEDTSLVVRRSELGTTAGGWRHQLELAPAGSILIECSAVEETEAPVPGGEYGDAGFRFEVLSC